MLCFARSDSMRDWAGPARRPDAPAGQDSKVPVVNSLQVYDIFLGPAGADGQLAPTAQVLRGEVFS
jgi:hypothetical protein